MKSASSLCYKDFAKERIKDLNISTRRLDDSNKKLVVLGYLKQYFQPIKQENGNESFSSYNPHKKFNIRRSMKAIKVNSSLKCSKKDKRRRYDRRRYLKQKLDGNCTFYYLNKWGYLPTSNKKLMESFQNKTIYEQIEIVNSHQSLLKCRTFYRVGIFNDYFDKVISYFENLYIIIIHNPTKEIEKSANTYSLHHYKEKMEMEVFRFADLGGREFKKSKNLKETLKKSKRQVKKEEECILLV